MRWSFILFALVVLVKADDEEVPELALAEECDQDACQLPDCRCSSTQIPGGLAPRDTPQDVHPEDAMQKRNTCLFPVEFPCLGLDKEVPVELFVTVTFDDGVNINNILTYREILYNRVNTNNCPAGATFYINHEYTNYQLVNELYNNGMEIALHSISHQTPQTYWAQANYETMRQEFGDQKMQMAHFANIPYEEIKGVRIPFLQLAGNSSFQVMADYGLEYDCSWPTVSFIEPALWPYSLHYASTQDCVIPPCPTASIPGPWIQPMVTWRDLNNNPCSMVDSCFWTPVLTDEDAWFQFIVSNFERHYLGNRAPFGFYIHEWYINANPAVKQALSRFMDLVNNLNDSFMVTSSEVQDWVKNPVPLNEYVQKPCRSFIPTTCPAASCGPLVAEHTQMQYWMQVCNVCPAVYPWLGNPLGIAQ